MPLAPRIAVVALALTLGGAAGGAEVHAAWEIGVGGLRGGLGNFKPEASAPGLGLCLLVDFGDGHLLRPRLGEWVFIRNQLMGDPNNQYKYTHTAAMTSVGLDYQWLTGGNVNDGFYLVAGAGVSRNRLSLDLPVPQTTTYALFHVSGTSTKPTFDVGMGYQLNAVCGAELRYENSRWVGPQDLTGRQTYRLNMLKAAATFRF